MKIVRVNMQEEGVPFEEMEVGALYMDRDGDLVMRAGDRALLSFSGDENGGYVVTNSPDQYGPYRPAPPGTQVIIDSAAD